MKKTTILRWLFSILLIAFWGFGTALAQDFNRYLDPNDKAAIAEEMKTFLLESGRFVDENKSPGIRGCATSLDEGFEGVDFPPAGWTVINGGEPFTWGKWYGMAHTGNIAAGILYGSTAHNDWLITPAIQPEIGNVDLSFLVKEFKFSSNRRV